MTRFYIPNLIKQILTFYGNSNFVFFFQFQWKNKIGFYNFLLCFSYFSSIPRIPTLFPAFSPLLSPFPPRFPAPPPYSPEPHPNSPHPHPISHILRILTPIPRIPTLIPHIPNILLIPFIDSPFRLLQIAFCIKWKQNQILHDDYTLLSLLRLHWIQNVKQKNE